MRNFKSKISIFFSGDGTAHPQTPSQCLPLVAFGHSPSPPPFPQILNPPLLEGRYFPTGFIFAQTHREEVNFRSVLFACWTVWRRLSCIRQSWAVTGHWEWTRRVRAITHRGGEHDSGDPQLGRRLSACRIICLWPLELLLVVTLWTGAVLRGRGANRALAPPPKSAISPTDLRG